VSVAVVEAETPGFGASGRNGGFCCLGGAKMDPAMMLRRWGAGATAQWQATERAAVDLVAGLLDRHGIDADRHSRGETRMAHRRRDMDGLRREADMMARGDGPDPELIEAADLPAHGMSGPFSGALTTPIGFGLNPRKYLFGLADAAVAAGAQLFQRSPVTALTRADGGHVLTAGSGRIRAETVLIATNGYSSEDMPDWLAGRYMPAQSTVLVTDPLSDADLSAQGWTSDQMAYDTRALLHYFRLMPDRRFLFGARGGLRASVGAEAAVRARLLRDFHSMFPGWAGVPVRHSWSGMVCLARDRTPYVGPVPDMPGVFAGLAWHGNGVAMGSHAGQILADLAMGRAPDLPYPAPMREPLRPFPLGRWRRLLMAPLYAGLALQDL
jgi:glycine/D-amino acid oxidase-like deaminating enzyme